MANKKKVKTRERNFRVKFLFFPRLIISKKKKKKRKEEEEKDEGEKEKKHVFLSV